MSMSLYCPLKEFLLWMMGELEVMASAFWVVKWLLGWKLFSELLPLHVVKLL